MRHIASGQQQIRTLEPLSGPMGDILHGLQAQLKELEMYRRKFGGLTGRSDGGNHVEEDPNSAEPEDGGEEEEVVGDDGEESDGSDTALER